VWIVRFTSQDAQKIGNLNPQKLRNVDIVDDNNNLISTARPTGLTNTVSIENVNIRHTQLVQGTHVTRTRGQGPDT